MEKPFKTATFYESPIFMMLQRTMLKIWKRGNAKLRALIVLFRYYLVWRELSILFRLVGMLLQPLRQKISVILLTLYSPEVWHLLFCQSLRLFESYRDNSTPCHYNCRRQTAESRKASARSVSSGGRLSWIRSKKMCSIRRFSSWHSFWCREWCYCHCRLHKSWTVKDWKLRCQLCRQKYGLC